MNYTKQAKCTLSPISDRENRTHSEVVTKQGQALERSGWMDGVRGFKAISGQKLGGFRALWLPLFANLIESHQEDGWFWSGFATDLIL